ncbi:MAG: hypothetical protein H6909_02180 [Rickettsiaceae bacterium]|nr:hypothetical protein [Rickettsiaceae bacterium]
MDTDNSTNNSKIVKTSTTIIDKISSGIAMLAGIISGMAAAVTINVLILSLGTAIFNPITAVTANLILGIPASYKSIKFSLNITDQYLTPKIKNMINTTINFGAKIMGRSQDITHQLPMKLEESKQLPIIQEHSSPVINAKQNQKSSEAEKTTLNKQEPNNLPSGNTATSVTINKSQTKVAPVKKPKIKSKKTKEPGKTEENTKVPLITK